MADEFVDEANAMEHDGEEAQLVAEGEDNYPVTELEAAELEVARATAERLEQELAVQQQQRLLVQAREVERSRMATLRAERSGLQVNTPAAPEQRVSFAASGLLAAGTGGTARAARQSRGTAGPAGNDENLGSGGGSAAAPRAANANANVQDDAHDGNVAAAPGARMASAVEQRREVIQSARVAAAGAQENVHDILTRLKEQQESSLLSNVAEKGWYTRTQRTDEQHRFEVTDGVSWLRVGTAVFPRTWDPAVVANTARFRAEVAKRKDMFDQLLADQEHEQQTRERELEAARDEGRRHEGDLAKAKYLYETKVGKRSRGAARAAEPERFSGGSEAHCEAWLQQMSDYLEVTEEVHPRDVLIAAGYLTGAARLLWRSHRASAERAGVAIDLPLLQTVLRDAYVPRTQGVEGRVMLFNPAFMMDRLKLGRALHLQKFMVDLDQIVAEVSAVLGSGASAVLAVLTNQEFMKIHVGLVFTLVYFGRKAFDLVRLNDAHQDHRDYASLVAQWSKNEAVLVAGYEEYMATHEPAHEGKQPKRAREFNGAEGVYSGAGGSGLHSTHAGAARGGSGLYSTHASAARGGFGQHGTQPSMAAGNARGTAGMGQQQAPASSPRTPAMEAKFREPKAPPFGGCRACKGPHWHSDCTWGKPGASSEDRAKWEASKPARFRQARP